MKTFGVLAIAVVAIVIAISTGCTKPSSPSVSDTFESSGRSLTIWHDQFEVARQHALETGKPILADFTGSTWCGWCVKLREDVFDTPEFEQWARDNVVLLELDYPVPSRGNAGLDPEKEKLASLYGIDSFPTVLLLDAQGNELARMGYERSPGEWLTRLESQLR